VQPTEPSPTAARRSPSLLLSALFALLVIAVFSNVLLGRRNFGGRDLRGYHLPIEKAVHDAYRRGELPVWIDTIAGGRPLAANPNVGAFYPVRPLLAALPFPLAMRIYPPLHWIAAGIGVLLLARRLGASPAAAWMAAVTFVFSGVSISEVIFTNIHPGLTLLPWVLLLFLRALDGPSHRTVALALALGLFFLVGDVVTSGLAIGICLLWTVLEVRREQAIPALRVLGVATGLGALLALPQIVATAAWIPHTTRSVLGLKFWEAFIYSVSPFRLLELFVPLPFTRAVAMEVHTAWGLGVFDGRPVGFFLSLYAGALPVLGIVLARRERRGPARFALVLIGISLLLAVPGVFLKKYFPNLTFPIPLRYPEKILVIFTLGLAILAAFAYDRIRKEGTPGRWSIVVAAILAAVSVAATRAPEAVGSAAVAITGSRPDAAAMAGRVIGESFALGGLLWSLSLLAAAALAPAASPKLGLVGLAILTLVPIAATRHLAESFSEEEMFAPPAFVRWVRKQDPEGAYRVLGESFYRAPSTHETPKYEADPGQIQYATRNFDQYTHSMWGLGTIFNNDFDHGDLSRLDTLRKMSFAAGLYRDSQTFWSTYALRFGVSYADLDPVAGFRRVGGDALQVWSVNETALPAIRVAGRWREVSGALEAGTLISTIAPPEVLVETGRRGAGENSGRVVVRSQTPERLDLEVEAARPGYLFVLRGYWPFRRVTVDGEPVETFPAQIAFTAVPIPAGRHAVAWEERLPGAPLSWAGPLAFLAVAGIARRRREASR
jgi:hypothetical protein